TLLLLVTRRPPPSSTLFPYTTLFRSFLENEKTVTQFCRKLAAERPLKDIRDEYNYPKKKGIKDECSRLLEASTMKSRRGFQQSRSEERFSRNAETDLVCRLLLEKKNK